MAEAEEMLKTILRRMAMGRLERGMRAASGQLVAILRASVDGAAAKAEKIAAAVTPFIYVDEGGKQRRGRRGSPWQPGGPTAESFHRGGPPGKVTGDGQASIKYQLVERDDAAGRIAVLIGVDDSAPGGFRRFPSYLFAWDIGIRYPTIGPAKGMGAVIQKPWLRVGIDRYMPEFEAIVNENVELT